MEKKQNAQGIIYIVLAYLFWGVLPLYWKLLESVSPLEILSHRILWSTVLSLILCFFIKRRIVFNYFTHPQSLVRLALTGALLAVNWGVFIYAVNSGQLVEASLGYFINPLISIVLGMIFMGEKLNKTQLTAFLFAMIGVAYLTLNYGHFPWIAIILALSFGFYGLLKKKMNYDSMGALAVETALIAPLAIGFLLYSSFSEVGGSFISFQFPIPFLLVLAGIVTALPLYWFGMAAIKIPLYSIGFFQYIAPIINLIIGIYIFQETFSITHIISFSFIWIGLALYIGNLIYKRYH